MLKRNLILIFIQIVTQQCFAQNAVSADSIIIDTSKSSNWQNDEHLPFLNLSNFHFSKKNQPTESHLLIPKNSVLDWELLKYSLSSDLNFDNSYNTKSSDFEYSKNRLSKFLSDKYKEIPNYDLGTFGETLGLTNKFITILLAILSIL